MKVIVCESYEEMSARAAEIFAEQIKEKSDSVLGLATGSTPIGMYDRLVDKYNDGALDFSGVTTFNLDEYYPIKKSDRQSYHSFMNEHFLGKVNVDRERTHIPNGEASDPTSECAEYEEKINAAGGIDLQILGVGQNGHIGFNEPKDGLDAGMHITELSESTLEANSRFFSADEKMPTMALTMGMENIMKAKKILLLASGKSKQEALRNLLSRVVTTDCPVSFLQLHPNVTLIADREAMPNI